MAKILSLSEYIAAYKKSHPNDTVKKKVVEGVSIWQRLGVLLGLIAVNILSASHTIPVMLETVKAENNDIKYVIAVAAFIAIEFTMILFMVFGKSGWLRTSVIAGALAVAIIANLSSTLANVGTSIYGSGAPIVGVILGLFAPLANLGIGEVYRDMQERASEAEEKASKEFEDAKKKWDQKLLQNYETYLTKIGIKDKNERMAYIAGTVTDEQPTPVVTEERLTPPRVTTPTRQKIHTGSKVQWLVNQMLIDKTVDLTYLQLQERYGVGPATVKAAKAIIKEMPQNRV